MSNISLNTTRYFFKIVTFWVLQIFNGLLLTKSIKTYLLKEYLQDEKNNKFTQKKDEKATK